MSLKNKIQYYLEKNKYISLQELENLCHSEGYKLSNAERRLRELMSVSPNIKPVKNSAGAIIAYKYESFDVEKWNEQFKKEPVKETEDERLLTYFNPQPNSGKKE
jgi:hypothetical protein